jgi:hypothetical protein
MFGGYRMSLLLLAAICLVAWAPEDAAKTGTILITAQLDAPTPAPPEIVVDKNIPFCGERIEDPILLTKEGAILNIVAYVDWQGEKMLPEERASLRLKTVGCLMEPRIQTTHTGAFLVLNSTDEITHNPHGWLDGERTVFNLTLTDPSMSFKRRLRFPGEYRIDCDTHAWMKAYIHAFDHPFHGVGADNGAIEISGVPAGKHRIKVWHEVLGELETEIEVIAGETVEWRPAFPLRDLRIDKIKPRTAEPWPAK